MSIYRCGYMYVHMYIKYTPQQAMILQTTLYFSWALGADVTEASHPQCSLVYLACIVPLVSVSPLMQKLRAQGPSSPLCPSPIIVWYSAQTSCPFVCLPESLLPPWFYRTNTGAKTRGFGGCYFELGFCVPGVLRRCPPKTFPAAGHCGRCPVGSGPAHGVMR